MAPNPQAAPRQVRLGVIGTGLAAKRLHWPALMQMPDRFAIVAYANRTRPKADEFAAMVGLSPKDYYADYQDLLTRDDVEAVLIGLPIVAQLAVVRDCLAAGKHVIVEKPAGGNEQEAQQFLALAGQYPNLKLEIAENFFYRDDLRLARSMLDAGMIGQPKLVTWHGVSRMVPEPGEWLSTPWRQAPEHRGGIVLDAGVHHVAQIRMFAGDFRRVWARAAEVNPTMSGPTSITMAFDLASGATGSYMASYVDVPLAEVGESCLVCGTEGSLSVGSEGVKLRRPDGLLDEYTFAGMDGGYYNEFLNFYEAVVFGAPVISDVAQNYKNALAILRALDSAESGQWQEVPEGPGGAQAMSVPLWKPHGASGMFEGLPAHISSVTGKG